MAKFVTNLKTNLPISKIGGKGYSLAILARKGFNVPQGFVITSSTFFEFLKGNNLHNDIDNLVSRLTETNFQEVSQEIKNLFLKGKIAEEVVKEIRDHLQKLGTRYLSIRSSAVSEDTPRASFAGLFDTFLNIKGELPLVLESVKRCWASLFNDRAIIYRMEKRLPHLEGMAIIVQEMIRAEISGVTFTHHPLRKETLVMEATYGLGNLLVGGEIEPDEFIVDRETLEILETKTGHKNRMSIIINNELRVIDVPREVAVRLALTENTVKEIALICLKIEKIFNTPQDIEWCIADDKLWLLQSRPITGSYYECK